MVTIGIMIIAFGIIVALMSTKLLLEDYLSPKLADIIYMMYIVIEIIGFTLLGLGLCLK